MVHGRMTRPRAVGGGRTGPRGLGSGGGRGRRQDFPTRLPDRASSRLPSRTSESASPAPAAGSRAAAPAGEVPAQGLLGISPTRVDGEKRSPTSRVPYIRALQRMEGGGNRPWGWED